MPAGIVADPDPKSDGQAVRASPDEEGTNKDVVGQDEAVLADTATHDGETMPVDGSATLPEDAHNTVIDPSESDA